MPTRPTPRTAPKSAAGVPRRLIIFADRSLLMSQELLGPFLAEARRRSDVEVAAVCDASPRPEPNFLAKSVRMLGFAAVRLFNPPVAAFLPRSGELRRIARRAGVEVISPPGHDVNSDAFLSELRERWKPALGLSLGCLQIFRPGLLEMFDVVVNYHNGELPCYRGLDATAWAMYRGEERAGYAFHIMRPGIDDGPVLVEGSVPIRPAAAPLFVERENAATAAKQARIVLDRMIAGDPGRGQAGAGSYFSQRDGERIRRIDDPSRHTAAELQRRLRCFGNLRIRLGGRCWDVTALRETRSKAAWLSFETSDGKRLLLHRCRYLPPTLYRFYEWGRQRIGGSARR